MWIKVPLQFWDFVSASERSKVRKTGHLEVNRNKELRVREAFQMGVRDRRPRLNRGSCWIEETYRGYNLVMTTPHF